MGEKHSSFVWINTASNFDPVISNHELSWLLSLILCFEESDIYGTMFNTRTRGLFAGTCNIGSETVSLRVAKKGEYDLADKFHSLHSPSFPFSEFRGTLFLAAISKESPLHMQQEEQLVSQIAVDLPNFPEEVIRLWLLPFAVDLGWPPSTYGRWPLIFFNKNLNYWKGTIWNKEKMILDGINFSVEHQLRINGMYDAFYLGVDNAYARHLGMSGKQRMAILVKEILQTGTIPEPLIIWEESAGQYDVIDGNHRYLAYVICWRIWEEVAQLPESERKEKAADLGVAQITQPIPDQEVWFCKTIS